MLKDVLTGESKWCQGLAAMDQRGRYVFPDDWRAVKWDILGALFVCYPDNYFEKLKELYAKLCELWGEGKWENLREFNDHKSTTWHDIEYLIKNCNL